MITRLTYFNPVLDPYYQTKMTEKMREAVLEDRYEFGGPLDEPSDEHPANLVSSLATDGQHYPALDIDIPMKVVESSTPGHWHVYFPTVALTWGQYKDLLDALANAGILEQKYVDHSKIRGQTLLRPPGVDKFLLGVRG